MQDINIKPILFIPKSHSLYMLIDSSKMQIGGEPLFMPDHVNLIYNSISVLNAAKPILQLCIFKKHNWSR